MKKSHPERDKGKQTDEQDRVPAAFAAGTCVIVNTARDPSKGYIALRARSALSAIRTCTGQDNAQRTFTLRMARETGS